MTVQMGKNKIHWDIEYLKNNVSIGNILISKELELTISQKIKKEVLFVSL